MFTEHTLFPFRARPFLAMIIALTFLLAACGSDNADDAAVEPAADQDPTPTEVTTIADDPPETAEPESDPDPTPTEPPARPTPESDPDVELAPELTGLTDWRNSDPVLLEDLRGEPVLLVFWNSI